jgi:hypothetical protein
MTSATLSLPGGSSDLIQRDARIGDRELGRQEERKEDAEQEEVKTPRI